MATNAPFNYSVPCPEGFALDRYMLYVDINENVCDFNIVVNFALWMLWMVLFALAFVDLVLTYVFFPERAMKTSGSMSLHLGQRFTDVFYGVFLLATVALSIVGVAIPDLSVRNPTEAKIIWIIWWAWMSCLFAFVVLTNNKLSYAVTAPLRFRSATKVVQENVFEVPFFRWLRRFQIFVGFFYLSSVLVVFAVLPHLSRYDYNQKNNSVKSGFLLFGCFLAVETTIMLVTFERIRAITKQQAQFHESISAQLNVQSEMARTMSQLTTNLRVASIACASIGFPIAAVWMYIGIWLGMRYYMAHLIMGWSLTMVVGNMILSKTAFYLFVRVVVFPMLGSVSASYGSSQEHSDREHHRDSSLDQKHVGADSTPASPLPRTSFALAPLAASGPTSPVAGRAATPSVLLQNIDVGELADVLGSSKEMARAPASLSDVSDASGAGEQAPPSRASLDDPGNAV
eukprot:Unigene5889_Nuclearia_a/m.18012 Unigene5889_Nuclearia_a/g.18012  ORF Unigene5889_Nuclearia_a/g.18012 Unigene5889_Nuclearia_a/m.18012 type:complete len:457 (-) Unigene5889_Nuclearia_a:143-1513(-)